MSQKISLIAQARQQLSLAAHAPSGRSAKTIFGGHERMLRQTVIALCARRELEEHNNPGEATLHVIQGHIRLIAGSTVWEGLPGDFLIVPTARHSVQAVEDSAFVLTVVKTV
ncbi:cupin domain-containing protein [Microbacterium elymi]|uniref:Cupin domain-containing protein n=1 Tax=Microbacterium elymi TaxID=2909587 RepID=A0ABY5NGY1_9MICO|nr:MULTISPECIES: cupin domain-containing protein [Microbacterium]UUT34403.1 cupin domain-containing protein [Microbacterium elymi]